MNINTSPLCLGTCVGVDAVVGFHHDEAGVSSAGIGRGEAGGGGGHARCQSDGQSGWIVAPGLPLRTREELMRPSAGPSGHSEDLQCAHDHQETLSKTPRWTGCEDDDDVQEIHLHWD